MTFFYISLLYISVSGIESSILKNSNKFLVVQKIMLNSFQVHFLVVNNNKELEII